MGRYWEKGIHKTLLLLPALPFKMSKLQYQIVVDLPAPLHVLRAHLILVNCAEIPDHDFHEHAMQ